MTGSVGSKGKVLSFATHARRHKDWTKAEHDLLVLAMRHLQFRGKSHFPEYFSDDQGNPCVAFTAGYHVDATYSISKVDGRYVVLNFEGRCIADSKSLLSALATALCGGFRDPSWVFLHGLDCIETIYTEVHERRAGGTV